MEETNQNRIPHDIVFRKSMVKNCRGNALYILIPINTNFILKGDSYTPNKIPTILKYNKLSQTPSYENFLNTNYGILAGKENNLTILDIDDLKRFEDFLKTKGVSLEYFKKTTWTAQSQRSSGGIHIYYKYDPLLRSSISSSKYIDIMNDNNKYVVCPPSQYSKKRKYRWLHRYNVKEPALVIPEFLKKHLLDLLKEERGKRNSEYKQFCHAKNLNDFLIIILPFMLSLLIIILAVCFIFTR